MNFKDTSLPYEAFKIIRKYVGERDPLVKKALISHVYDKVDGMFRNIYGIPNIDANGLLTWSVIPLSRDMEERKIVALGKFEYVRTVPVYDGDGNYERKTFVYRSPRGIWNFFDFMRYVTSCETELRENYNINIGHLFFDGVDIVEVNGYQRVYPFIH